MDLLSLAVIAAALLLFSLLSGRLQGSVITAPMVFVGFGFLIGPGGLSIADVDPGQSVIHTIAELTLILVLFSDAARIDVKRLRTDHNLPVRMLMFGLPLTIILGAIVARLMFPSFSLWEAALLAALLAPTDAALGQSVVTAKEVPVRVRQAINVESGLNDGIALPAVLLLAALAGGYQESVGAGEWLVFGLLQVTLGPLVGLAIGYTGGRLLDSAGQRGWATTSFQGIGILALALLIFMLAELVGGNGFIAAFIGGMTFGYTVRHRCTFLFEFMETEGQLLMLLTFLVFGAALLPPGLASLDLTIFTYAVLSLTLIRMIPIGISLLGAGLRIPTNLFLGWFGPRGLASILFVMLILEEAEIVHRSQLFSIIIVTVGLSVLLHGLTAAPFARRYGTVAGRMGECEENQPAPEQPLRGGPMTTDTNKQRTSFK